MKFINSSIVSCWPVQFYQPNIKTITELKKYKTPFIALTGTNFKGNFAAFFKEKDLYRR